MPATRRGRLDLFFFPSRCLWSRVERGHGLKRTRFPIEDSCSPLLALILDHLLSHGYLQQDISHTLDPVLRHCLARNPVTLLSCVAQRPLNPLPPRRLPTTEILLGASPGLTRYMSAAPAPPCCSSRHREIQRRSIRYPCTTHIRATALHTS